MSKHLLWEIGTEELPARFIKPALKSLKEKDNTTILMAILV